MTETKISAPGADWTKLLADPDIVRHLGELLQSYRDAEPARRNQVLLETMRKIKSEAPSVQAASSKVTPEPPVATTPAATPPFEPDIFTPCWGQDRRRYPRMKCFVVVELRVAGSPTPVWGNLTNTSLGGCQVETAAHISGGAKVEVGLWVASGKIWVKGLALNGVVTRSAPAAGVRLRFAGMDATGKENLRQFLKYIQEATRSLNSENSYLQLLK